jgi:hypothetical protein
MTDVMDRPPPARAAAARATIDGFAAAARDARQPSKTADFNMGHRAHRMTRASQVGIAALFSSRVSSGVSATPGVR